MATLLVVERLDDWAHTISGVEVIHARTYLTDPEYATRRGAKVYNLCRSYRYQSAGYYVSLLAAARGHRPMPSVATIQDLKSRSIIRFVSDEVDEVIQKALAPLTSSEFTLSVYFGRNMARRYERLCRYLFNMFPAPLLRAQFKREEDGRWELAGLRAVATRDVPENHRDFVVQVAGEFFAGRRVGGPPKKQWRYDLAIWVNPEEVEPPSDEKAIQRFVKAAHALGMRTELITRDDSGRLAEFDALFLRETTQVNHHTYRAARRAAAEGLVVVDDPDSIVKCGNKVYLAEALARAGIAAPRTVVLHNYNLDEVRDRIGFPCILKLPDSSFSQGVTRAASWEELQEKAHTYLQESDLLIAQEFVPTEFDWRIGIFARRPLFACRYFMARGHWQILNWDNKATRRYGKVECVPLGEAPKKVLRTALKAANLIGDGLYGVDIKEIKGKPMVIEINDNPTIQSGCEDSVSGDYLYMEIMHEFLDRIERNKKEGRSGV